MEPCTQSTLATCQQACRTMFFGLRDFYDIRTNTCQQWVTCPLPTVLDKEINQCVGQDGKVVVADPMNAPEKVCGVNSIWNSDFQSCICNTGWFKDPATNLCDQNDNLQVQTYGVIEVMTPEQMSQKATQTAVVLMQVILMVICFSLVLLVLCRLREMFGIMDQSSWINHYIKEVEEAAKLHKKRKDMIKKEQI